MNLLSIGSRRSKIGLLIVFALASGFYACGGGGGGGGDGAPADTTAPTVDSRSPDSGATKVLTNATVTATFSEAMDATTITTSTFTLDEASAVTGSVSYSAGTLTATFTPTSSLKPGTPHTATLTTTVADSAGNGLASANAWSFTTEDFIYRLSVDSFGTEANGGNYGVAISADGRYVAFISDATNLVTGDTNGYADTFIHDTLTGTTTRLSVASDGTQGDDASFETPAISSDGRYVAFSSWATSLVTGDTNGFADTFIHDTLTGTTTRISVASDGTQGDDASEDTPAISSDGRYVAFASEATNLVIGDTNGTVDAFIRDTLTGTTTRISVASDGTQGDDASFEAPAISSDGRYVAFSSWATNLVTGDTNVVQDVFVRDTVNNTTTRVSVDSSGTQGNANSGGHSISADGRYVVFSSWATNLVTDDTNGRKDVFVRDMVNNTTTRVSVDSSGAEANDHSNSYGHSIISSDGRYVAFGSSATNLVANDINGMEDIFVRNTLNNTTIRISLDSSGTEGDGDSQKAAISADGRYVAFISNATNLVSSDTNAVGDIFRALNTAL